MPYPTVEEARIYKSPYKFFQVRCATRLDHPVFTDPFEDNFSGSALNEDLWNKKLPTWGSIVVAGGTVTIGTLGIAISPAWISSKPNMAFPKTTDTDWTFETRMRFQNLTVFGVFLRICTLEDANGILGISCNSVVGLDVTFPDRGTERWAPGVDTTWNRYKLAYSAASKEYTLSIDANDDGAYELGPWTISSVGLRADYIAVGNTVARQGTALNWTEIEIDWIRVTGTSESYEFPVWANPSYMYDALGYDNEVWTVLPTVLRGRIDIHKRNVADALQIDLLNFSHGYDPANPMWRLYTDFSFANRPIKVESRVSDGFNWTPWRTIFIGSCDEKQIELRENGEPVLTVTARDIVRKKLATTHIIRAYATYDTLIEGLHVNMSVQEIIWDIVQNAAGLPYSALYVQGTPYNQPMTFNIAGDSCADAIVRLLDETALCWYPRLEDFQIQVQDWFYGTDTPGYRMSTAEEVSVVQWSESAVGALANLELAIENTEFEAGGFSTNYPHVPVPFFGRTLYESTITAQSDGDLFNNPLHFKRWKRANREIGSILITGECQDWVSHDLEIAVLDSKYLGLREDHGPWVIDGWTHDWEGDKRFSTETHLVNQHPDRLIRSSLQGHI